MWLINTRLQMVKRVKLFGKRAILDVVKMTAAQCKFIQYFVIVVLYFINVYTL